MRRKSLYKLNNKSEKHRGKQNEQNTLDNSFKNLYDSSPLNFRNSISLIDSQNYVTNNNSLNTFFSK